MEGNKTVWWVLGVIVVAIAVVIVMRWSGDVGLLTGSPVPTPTPTSTPLAATPTVSAKAAPAPSAASYNAALLQYANRRIQFDMRCQALPARSSLGNNTTIMLDNRSGDARTVAVGGTKYNLVGYGWRIITLHAATVPSTLMLDCGSSRNVGSIVVN